MRYTSARQKCKKIFESNIFQECQRGNDQYDEKFVHDRDFADYIEKVYLMKNYYY